MGRAFKYKDGDYIGPVPIQMIHRLYKKGRRWFGEFQCPVCKKLFIAPIGNIQEGNIKSCGCNSKRPHEDLAGRTYGRLTVLRYLYSDRHGPIWECQCSCHQKTILQVYGSNLTSGNTTSCGCIQKERTSQTHFKDLTNKRFGKLTALYTIGKQNGSYIWHCKCDCGRYSDVISSNLLMGTTKSCGHCIASYGEKFIEEYLKNKNIVFEMQKTFTDLINPQSNKKLYIDFYIPKLNLAIECDGEQHRQEKGSGYYTEQTLKHIQYLDSIKDSWCKSNGITIYRIVYKNKNSLKSVKEQLDAYFNTL